MGIRVYLHDLDHVQRERQVDRQTYGRIKFINTFQLHWNVLKILKIF